MARSRTSARQAGTRFETSIATGLAQALNDDRIERRARNGNKDRGDIAGIRIHGQRLVIEAKNHARLDLPGWTREAHLEAGNDDALTGIVVHKRRGTTNPLDQWVTMTVADLVALITGWPAPSNDDEPDENALRGPQSAAACAGDTDTPGVGVSSASVSAGGR